MTITNCFRHVRIQNNEIKDTTENTTEDTTESTIENTTKNMENTESEIVTAINHNIQSLYYHYPMMVKDFLNPKNEEIIEKELSDMEIVEFVCKSKKIEEEMENEDELPTVLAKEALQSFDRIVKFFLKQEGNYSMEIGNLMKVGCTLRRLEEKSHVQKNMEDYFESL
ncbi:12122_t:CDS:1 [Acaulospora morrowiae]|uniref:12122_t:CDS:1 n=1 Tax=Acaulospora morrowiae TaxID=94023 RepID=A0A9N9DMU2_9GLOM|nr:12122_t:CDS:1 [Acaulospora morrowiae]